MKLNIVTVVKCAYTIITFIIVVYSIIMILLLRWNVRS